MSAIENRYNFLLSDLAELNRLISMTPESAVIDRKTLEYRRSQVQEEIDKFPMPPRWPASAHLVFNGKPVMDREGIYANFASNAVGAFTKAVTSLAASQEAVLGERGVIPNKEDYRLLITGTSHGSFGFEIEEILEHQANLIPEESPVEQAIGHAKEIMESLLSDEEAIAEAISDTDERALNDIRDFLKVMAESDAICSLSFKNAVFGFRDVGQVQRGLASLGNDNIHEGEAVMSGHFQGFLPKSRRAEFVADESGEVLSCRVDRSMDNANEINRILGQRINLRTRFRQVGNSRRRYTIVDFERISGT